MPILSISGCKMIFSFSVCLYLLFHLQAVATETRSHYIQDVENKVDIKLYYECLCPYSRDFYINLFSPVVQKLSQYLNIYTYPYGNAQTIEENGHVEFRCQHGPAECYGNKLHACAGGVLGNTTAVIMFNACLMGGRNWGSDDVAADRCAKYFNINSEPIKVCAKGERGTQLLKYYGGESKKVHFPGVPYILINGVMEKDRDYFKRDVCAAFTVPPPPCLEVLYV